MKKDPALIEHLQQLRRTLEHRKTATRRLREFVRDASAIDPDVREVITTLFSACLAALVDLGDDEIYAQHKATYQTLDAAVKKAKPLVDSIKGRKTEAEGDFDEFTGDQDAGEELELYAQNTSELYHEWFIPIAAKLMKFRQAGTYDHNKALRFFVMMMNEAARLYVKEIRGGEGEPFTVFSPEARRIAAEGVLQYFENEADLGNFDRLLNKA